jgi:tetratricopeptide (TPR) repeat protein
MEFLLLLLVVGWIAYAFASERGQEKREAHQFDEKIAMRRAAVARVPDSAGAVESLGDVLREAGQYAEALACYERAAEMVAANPGSGAGLIGGSGLDNKIRLTRMDKDSVGGVYGQTLTTRQTLCRQCGRLNGPQDRNCEMCGADLPVDTMMDAWNRDDIRKPVLREVGLGLLMVHIVLLAVFIASWMPLEIKGCLLISTIAVVTWRVLRAIGGK